MPALLARDWRVSGVRAVAGVSTGGYGAMAHAARHPGSFTAAASYSGIIDTTAPGVPALMDAIVVREFLPPRSLWGSPVLNLLTWRDFNPRPRAEGLRGTTLHVSSGSGVVGGVGDWLPEALESVLWPYPPTPSPTGSRCCVPPSRPTTTREEDTAGPSGSGSSAHRGRCSPVRWGLGAAAD